MGLVRGIVIEARRLNNDERAALDARIDASQDRVLRMDPDDVLDAVAIAAAEVRDVRAIERAEERAAGANFLWTQAGLFDRGKIYGEYDNASLATIADAAAALAPVDDGRSVSQRMADGLVELARHRCPAAGCCDSPECDGDAGVVSAVGSTTGGVVLAPHGESPPQPVHRRVGLRGR